MSAGEIAYFLFDGPVSGVWPILLIPILAARLCDHSARDLPPAADSRIAAALAGLPGTVLVVLHLAAMLRSVLHLHHGDWLHGLQYHFIWIATPVVLLPAIMRARRTSRRLKALILSSDRPEQRLAAAAERIGIPCRALPLDAPECFVAGAFKPIAYVSRGAVARLTDAELDAVLRHEQAHIKSRDPLAYTVLSFLGSLAGRGDRALASFMQAREREADLRAASQSGPLALASALLVFSRAQLRTAPGMSGAGSGARRIEALLQPAAAPPAATRVPAGLTLCVLLLAWPPVQSGLSHLLCSS